MLTHKINQNNCANTQSKILKQIKTRSKSYANTKDSIPDTLC